MKRTATLTFAAILLLTASAAFAGEETLTTEASVFIGYPAETQGSQGVLILPGTVIPLDGRQPTEPEEIRRHEEARSTRILRTTEQLRSTLRLGEIQMSHGEPLELAVDEHRRLPPPIPDWEVTFDVRLLSFDKFTATYEVKILDGDRVIAEPRVASVRGERAIVSTSSNGGNLRYLFLVLEPERLLPLPRKVEEGITHPRAQNKIAPAYTTEARKARIQGLVILRTVIETDGTISEIDVLKGLPKGLDKAAVDAVRQWTFEPALDAGGAPVRVYYNLTINFRLEKDKKKEDGG